MEITMSKKDTLALRDILVHSLNRTTNMDRRKLLTRLVKRFEQSLDTATSK